MNTAFPAMAQRAFKLLYRELGPKWDVVFYGSSASHGELARATFGNIGISAHAPLKRGKGIHYSFAIGAPLRIVEGSFSSPLRALEKAHNTIVREIEELRRMRAEIFPMDTFRSEDYGKVPVPVIIDLFSPVEYKGTIGFISSLSMTNCSEDRPAVFDLDIS